MPTVLWNWCICILNVLAAHDHRNGIAHLFSTTLIYSENHSSLYFQIDRFQFAFKCSQIFSFRYKNYDLCLKFRLCFHWVIYLSIFRRGKWIRFQNSVCMNICCITTINFTVKRPFLGVFAKTVKNGNIVSVPPRLILSKMASIWLQNKTTTAKGGEIKIPFSTIVFKRFVFMFISPIKRKTRTMSFFSSSVCCGTPSSCNHIWFFIFPSVLCCCRQHSCLSLNNENKIFVIGADTAHQIIDDSDFIFVGWWGSERYRDRPTIAAAAAKNAPQQTYTHAVCSSIAVPFWRQRLLL